MATELFSTIAKDDVTCPVCFKLLRDPNTPKLLECSHVCCAVCIQKMIGEDVRFVDCPECRHVTQIPEEGITAMKTIPWVRSLAETFEDHDSKKGQATTSNQNPSKRTRTTAAMCPEHNITIEFYCKVCNVCGCALCILNKHKGQQHDVDDLQNVHESRKGHMESMFSQAGKEIEECEKSVQELVFLQEEMERSLQIQQETLEQHAEITIWKVKEESQILMDELQQNEQSRIGHVQQEINRLQSVIQEAKTVVTTTKNEMEQTDKHEYLVKHDQLTQTISAALGKDTKGQINRNPVVGMTKYVQDKPLKEEGNIGKIVQVRQLKCEFIQAFGEFQGAHDIVARPSGLFVVNDCTGAEVCIYNQMQDGQYKKQSSLSLSSINTTDNPYGVAVTAEGKYLVARDTHVEVYSPIGSYEGTLRCKEEDGRERPFESARRIIVTPNGRIVVAEWGRLILKIISQTGIILDEIGGIYYHGMKPWRTCVMQNEHIAVSDWEKGKVSVIDESGCEVTAFDVPQAHALCYYEQTDCLLVGRCLELTNDGSVKTGTGVIEQYCSTSGKLVACIAEGLYNPQDLSITCDGMLALADTNQVIVYKIV